MSLTRPGNRPAPKTPHHAPNGVSLRAAVRSGLLLFALAILAGCQLILPPPEHPTPENPPCLESSTPQGGATLTVTQIPTIKVKFSKELEPKTTTTEFIYLVQGDVDYSFLRDLETPSSITSTRLPFLTPITIKTVSAPGAATELEITPIDSLRGSSTYTLVFTLNVRDKLQELGENKRTGSRPLNVCPDANGNWPGEVENYKRGESQVIIFQTEPEPPRTGIPRINEVMASPPSAISSKGEYVEIYNADKSGDLDMCGLFIRNAENTPREIIAFAKGVTKCPTIKPGGYGVIMEPDYDMTANVYKIPSGVPMYTTRSSSGSTLVSGGLSATQSVTISQGTEDVVSVSPIIVSASGTWPSSVSLEKCDPNGANQSSNWAESTSTTGGTPGAANSAKCP